MRILALLLALACLAPAATAIRGLPNEAHVDLRHCTLDWTNHVDNQFVVLRCGVGTQEVLYYKRGSGFAGPWCEARVLGADEPLLCLP